MPLKVFLFIVMYVCMYFKINEYFRQKQSQSVTITCFLQRTVKASQSHLLLMVAGNLSHIDTEIQPLLVGNLAAAVVRINSLFFKIIRFYVKYIFAWKC